MADDTSFVAMIGITACCVIVVLGLVALYRRACHGHALLRTTSSLANMRFKAASVATPQSHERKPTDPWRPPAVPVHLTNKWAHQVLTARRGERTGPPDPASVDWTAPLQWEFRPARFVAPQGSVHGDEGALTWSTKYSVRRVHESEMITVQATRPLAPVRLPYESSAYFEVTIQSLAAAKSNPIGTRKEPGPGTSGVYAPTWDVVPGRIAVGFALRDYPAFVLPGTHNYSLALHSDGAVYSSRDQDPGESVKRPGPNCMLIPGGLKQGDVVGAGYEPVRASTTPAIQFFFCLNGVRLLPLPPRIGRFDLELAECCVALQQAAADETPASSRAHDSDDASEGGHGATVAVPKKEFDPGLLELARSAVNSPRDNPLLGYGMARPTIGATGAVRVRVSSSEPFLYRHGVRDTRGSLPSLGFGNKWAVAERARARNAGAEGHNEMKYGVVDATAERARQQDLHSQVLKAQARRASAQGGQETVINVATPNAERAQRLVSPLSEGKEMGRIAYERRARAGAAQNPDYLEDAKESDPSDAMDRYRVSDDAGSDTNGARRSPPRQSIAGPGEPVYLMGATVKGAEKNAAMRQKRNSRAAAKAKSRRRRSESDADAALRLRTQEDLRSLAAGWNANAVLSPAGRRVKKLAPLGLAPAHDYGITPKAGSPAAGVGAKTGFFRAASSASSDVGDEAAASGQTTLATSAIGAGARRSRISIDRARPRVMY